MNLDFLKDVKVEAVQKTAPAKREAKQRLPENADIRVFANGMVYPSEAFASKHDLEFGQRVADEKGNLQPVGNGMDVFSSKDWSMIGQLPQTVIFAAVVPKSAAKVDLWGSTKYDEEGNPKATVLSQGAQTFGKTMLVPMLEDAYGIDWENTEYVDLTFVEEQPMVSTNGIYIVPKVISTGAKKGEPTYIRRENLSICPLVVAESKTNSVPNEIQDESEAPALEAFQSNGTTSEVDADLAAVPQGKGWSKSAMETAN